MPPLFSNNLNDCALCEATAQKAEHCYCVHGSAGGSCARIARTLASAAHQAQHHHEQIDEVEVERQRAHHGLAAGRSGVIAGVVHPLDPLGIVGREARKDADADNGNHPIQPARSQKQIDQARDDDADQAHEQESSESRQVSLGGVTPDAERTEGRRRDKEHPRDRGLRVDVEDGRQ